MAVTALVTLSGIEQSSGMLTAYAGTAVRGVQDTPSMPPFGPYTGKAMFQITIYANGGGDTMSFTFVTGGVATSLAETLAFTINSNVGSVLTPFSLTSALVASTPPPNSPPPSPPAEAACTALCFGLACADVFGSFRSDCDQLIVGCPACGDPGCLCAPTLFSPPPPSRLFQRCWQIRILGDECGGRMCRTRVEVVQECGPGKGGGLARCKE
jgi:hypothetical protein